MAKKAKQTKYKPPTRKQLLEGITKVTLPSDFEEVVDALSTADGWMDRVVLYTDQNLNHVLEAMKYANRNARGSYGGGAGLKNLYRKKGYIAVQEAVVKFCKKYNIEVYTTQLTRQYVKVS